MQINVTNYKQFTTQEIFDSIVKGDFTFQTVNYDTIFLSRLVVELATREHEQAKAFADLLEEVKAIRIALSDLQKIQMEYEHPLADQGAQYSQPLSVNDSDIAAANSHLEKRSAADLEESNKAALQVEEDRKKLEAEVEQNRIEAERAQAELDKLMLETEQINNDRQKAIEEAKQKAEDLKKKAAESKARIETV